MRTGKLRQRVTLQQGTASQNSFGESVITWSTLATVWADVAPPMTVAQRERFAQGGDQMQARVNYQARMRYRAGISPATNRIIWEGRTLEIEGVLDPDGRNREMIALCYEVQV